MANFNNYKVDIYNENLRELNQMESIEMNNISFKWILFETDLCHSCSYLHTQATTHKNQTIRNA